MRLSTLLLAFLLGGGHALASPQVPRQPIDRPGDAFTGTLSAVDALSLTVRADSGAVVTFVVDDPMVVPPGLVPGTRVTVRHEPLEGGGRRVMRVGIASYPWEVGSTTEPPPDTSPSPGAGQTSREALPPPPTSSSPSTRTPGEKRPPASGPPVASLRDATPAASPLPSALPSAVPVGAPHGTPKPSLPLDQAPPGLLHLLAFIVLILAAGALLVFSARS
jgi:hypothetical protein